MHAIYFDALILPRPSVSAHCHTPLCPIELTTDGRLACVAQVLRSTDFLARHPLSAGHSTGTAPLIFTHSDLLDVVRNAAAQRSSGLPPRSTAAFMSHVSILVLTVGASIRLKT